MEAMSQFKVGDEVVLNPRTSGAHREGRVLKHGVRYIITRTVGDYVQLAGAGYIWWDESRFVLAEVMPTVGSSVYNPTNRVVTHRRYEFECESQYGQPPTLRDVQDTIHVALSKLREIKGEKADQYDDALHLRPTDEGVIFYFEVDE